MMEIVMSIMNSDERSQGDEEKDEKSSGQHYFKI